MAIGRWVVVVALAAGSACLGCADRQAPEWGEGAALEAVEIGDAWLTVAWPAAEDRAGVTGYRVSRDGEVVAELGAGEWRELCVEELAEFTEYTLAVVALDEAGNASAPLSATLRTADVSAPRWDPDCGLEAELDEDGERPRVALSWCAASDNDRVDHFAIRRDDAELQRAGPDEHHATLEVEEVAGYYAVRACDPAGNCSRAQGRGLDEQGRDVRQVRADERRKAMDRQIAQSAGILAALSDIDSSSFLGVGSAFDADDAVWGDLDGIGEDAAFGIGGVGLVGTGRGGGGTAEGLGGLGTIGHGGGGGAGSGYGVGGLAVAGGGGSYAPPSATVIGGDPALVAHAERRASRVEHCYRNALAEEAGLAGTVTATLVADAEGALTVESVSGAGGATLTGCVATALRGRLPEAPGEALSGTVTIRLDPGGTK